MEKWASDFAGREFVLSSNDFVAPLVSAVRELLVKFENRTKTKPQQLIYFRDGDDKIDQSSNADLEVIRQAWSQFASDIELPKILYVVVSRKHKLRAFVEEDNRGHFGNAPAGTVIDKVVVDPSKTLFYLFGHEGKLGTSRPARYTVVMNDLSIPMQEVQDLCFYFCHAFGADARSIAVVAHVHYAHILAERAHLLNVAQAPGNNPVHPALRNISFFV